MTVAAIDVITEWFDRVWTQEDASAIDEMFVPDGIARGLGSNILYGPEEFREFHRALLSHICEMHITVDRSITEGEWSSFVCSVSARGRTNNADICFTGTAFVKIVDGKITEAYNHFDFLTMFGQLGLMPESAFDQALASGLDC